MIDSYTQLYSESFWQMKSQRFHYAYKLLERSIRGYCQRSQGISRKGTVVMVVVGGGGVIVIIINYYY